MSFHAPQTACMKVVISTSMLEVLHGRASVMPNLPAALNFELRAILLESHVPLCLCGCISSRDKKSVELQKCPIGRPVLARDGVHDHDSA